MDIILSYLKERPILVIIAFSFLISFFINKTKRSTIFLPFIFILSFIYFTPITVIYLIVLFFVILFLSKTYSLNFIFIFFLFLESYIFGSFLLNPALSIIFTSSLSVFFILLKRKEISLGSIYNKLISFISSLNFLDIFIIVLTFTLGSLPQTFYDATHANLYNAKWYINLNSIKPLPESISSLFPQNGIIYYSFFYLLGKEKGLQLAYLLPAIIFIYWFKQKKVSSFLPYTLILVPIFIFEASNGYYDLLVASLIVSSLFLSHKFPYQAAFLVGYAAASKYFPIIIFPFLFILSPRLTFKKLFFIVLLSVLPLSLWLFRSFQYTGSPVFPFAQKIFPTPNLWSASDVLENQGSLPTTISAVDWLKGKIFLYPFKSFFYTDQFMEATNYFPTFTPILATILFIIFLPKIFSEKNKSEKLLLLTSFIIFYFSGGLVRYYRYLWPFQLLFGLIFFIWLSSKIKNHKLKTLINLFSLVILVINLRYTTAYYRVFVPNLKHILQPNYFVNSNESLDPTIFLNQNTKSINSKILDSSANLLHRFDLKGRVYQCHWYWYTWSNDLKNKNMLKNFNYIITSNPPSKAQNICSKTVSEILPKSTKIFENTYYQIYLPSWNENK